MITFASDISQQCQWYARRANRNQILITCLQSGGSAFNLSSYTFTFKVWVYGSESTPVISLSQGSGITNGGAAGTLLLDITEAQSTLTPNVYLMKLEATYPDTTVRTWINGNWILNGDLYDGGSATSVTINLNATGTPVTLTLNSAVSSTSGTWGSITGTLSQQTDLRNELAPGALLTFTQSASNPTLVGAGEASLIMVGSTCYAWIRQVGGTTVSLKTATNALLDNWSAGTPCTGLPASILFPTVFQYGSTFYMFIRKNTPTNQIFLYSSTDGIAWTALNSGNPVIQGSATATDWTKNLYNVGCVIVGSTIHILVEGNADSGTYNFPARGGYASADISSPTFTLQTTPQVFNCQCPQLFYAPEKNALFAIHTEWTSNSNPPSNYYGQTRFVAANASQNLLLSETWVKTSAYFPEIETPRSLNLAADYSFLLTPGKTYPSMMFYNYAQSTGYQAYAKNITSYDDLYRAIGPLEGQKLRPSFDRVTLGKDSAGQYRVDVYDANFPCIHVTHATADSLNDYGGYLDSAGLANNMLSAGFVYEKGGGVFRGKINGTGSMIYQNAGNIDFYINSVTQGATFTPTSRLRVSTAGVYAGGATTPHSTLQTGGSMAYAYVAKTALYTLTANDYAVEVTSGTHTQTLPTAVGIAGREYFITNSGTGVVTVGTTSSQTFVNVTATPTTLTLNQFQGVVVVSNGANWLKKSSF